MKCEKCGRKECYGGKDCFDLAKQSLERYQDEEILATTRASTALEGRHYMKLCRIEEVIEFAREMGYRHLGIAFCIGLSEEASVLAKVLKQHFKVTAVCCKTGGIEKEELSLEKIIDERTEAMCNPAGQAIRLNQVGTDLNLIVGLCVGHDIIFTKESAAPVTTVIVKDRLLGHNPVAALNSGYWRKRLGLVEATGKISRGK
jgi:uncharacterized metal-binding protein